MAGLEWLRSPIGVMRAVEAGVPVAALMDVAQAVAPGDRGFVFRLVSRAGLARRGERLSPAQGARVARLGSVWVMALEVWGDESEARGFLFRPHGLLDGGRPVDVVLGSEFGRPLVEGILGRLRHGVVA